MARLSWSNDPHGCFADYEQEMIEEAYYAAHLDGECSVGCLYCHYDEAANEEIS